jgi:hypothetical protein
MYCPPDGPPYGEGDANWSKRQLKIQDIQDVSYLLLLLRLLVGLLNWSIAWMMPL